MQSLKEKGRVNMLPILLTFGLMAAIALGFAYQATLRYWIAVAIIGGLLQGCGLAGQHSFRHLRKMRRFTRWPLYLLLVAVVTLIAGYILPGRRIETAANIVAVVIFTEFLAYLENRYKWR